MAWRDFYAPVGEVKILQETTLKETAVVDPVAAVASVTPTVVPPVSVNLGGDAPPATQLISESGAVCQVAGSAMPPPVKTDAARLCSNVRQFLG